MNYYSFIEVDDVNSLRHKKWLHLSYQDENGKEKRKSTGIQDILNYYGKQGWECIKVEFKPNEPEEYEFGGLWTDGPIVAIFKREIV